MTITSEETKVEVQSATADTFTFNLPIHKAGDLEVYVDGARTETDDGTNPYSVTVAANKQSASIVFTNTGEDAPHRGKPLIFSRVVDFKQETDLANNSLFDAESLETALDNIVMQTMQVGNVVLSSSGSTSFSFDTALGTGPTMFNSNATDASTLTKNLEARANKALAFDNLGDITVTATDINEAIDYQLEAEEWASLASGNVYDYTDGARDSDQGSISAKAQAAAAATSAGDAATDLATFQLAYRGASGSEPGTPVDGQLWYDSTNDVMKVYNGTSTAWEALTPSTAHMTAISAVNTDPLKTNIGLVAAIDDKIEDVAAIDTEIGQLAVLGTAGAHISTVAGITGGDISKVADIDGEVEDVAAIDTEITTLINGTDGTASTGGATKNILLVDGVHDKLTEVGNLGTSTVVGYMTALNASGVIGHMAALNATDVITNIGLVADIDDKVTDVAAIDDKVEDVAAIDDKVTTVAGLNTEVAALGASAVVTYMTNLNATGVINNMAALNGSGVIADIGTVADMEGEVNSFAVRYRVAGSEPGSDNDAGDLYFNTTSNTLYAFGSAWQPTAPSAADQANINIVAGDLTYEEDLGLITDAVTTGSGNDIDTVAGLETEIGLLAAKVAEMGLLGTAEHATNTTGTLARLGTAGVVEDMGHLGTGPNVLAMAELGTSTVVGNIASLTASGVVDNITTVAGMVADINRFATEYIISDSEPSSPSPTEGDLWYDSINNVLKYHNGTSFASISAELHNEMVQDTSPTLGGNLDADDKNLTNVGTISGDDLKVDFGSIA